MTDFDSGLAGTSNLITAIFTDNDASRINGKMYVVSAGDGAALSVVDLKEKILYDRYTISQKGRSNELLEYTDTVDIVIGE